MHMIVLGAKGDVGSRIVTETLSRRHEVSAVIRQDAQRDTLPHGVTPLVADAADPAALAPLLEGHDIAISALRPPDGQEDLLAPLTGSVLQASARTLVPVLIVGGAACLKLPGEDGGTVLSTPGFLPQSVLPIARACQAQYDRCAAETTADWSYACPPGMLAPGERTGRYRLGSDVLLTDDAGDSRISMEDFAVALIDEAETRKHRRSRFTVAY